MLFQTVGFIGFVFVNGILGKDKVEIVNEQIEQMYGLAVVLMKLFGSFSIGGNGQIALFGK
jgi:translation elongation factor EF-4